jgi:hypothetical protein
MRETQMNGWFPRQIAWMITAFAVLAGVCSCTSSTLEPAGPLIDSSDSQFAPAISVVVTNGTSGWERLGTHTLWWLTSAAADITVTNVASHTATVDVVATVAATPCGDAPTVIFSPSVATDARILVSTAGGRLFLELNVPQGQQTTIRVAVRTPACHIAGDPRQFFAGLEDLRGNPV